jgi:RecA/RadA recombinase
MAKKDKDAPKSALDEIFAKLIGQHNTVSAGSAALGNAMDSEIRHFVDTGLMNLNMILSNRPDGGWPCGRIVEVFGKESTGKSTLGYVAMASAQAAGGIAIYADIEKTGNAAFMKLLGINLDELITTDIPEIEKLFTALERNLTLIAQTPRFKNKPVMIVVDSVSALQTDAEMEGGYEYNMNVAMGKAKMLGKALKKIVPFLTSANACLYFVNQVRDNVSGYGEAFVVPGGKAIPFYSSIRVHLEGRTKIVLKDPTLENEYLDAMAKYKEAGGKKAGLEKPEKPKQNKDTETTIGYEVTAFTKKNKTAPSDRRTSFRIIFSQGLFEEECWLATCIKYGIVKKDGSKHTLVGIENDWGVFTEKQWIPKLQKDEKMYEAIRDLIIDKLTIPLEYDKTKYIVEDEAIEDDDADGYDVPTDNLEKD